MLQQIEVDSEYTILFEEELSCNKINTGLNLIAVYITVPIVVFLALLGGVFYILYPRYLKK